MNMTVVVFLLRAWTLQPCVFMPMSCIAIGCWIGACLVSSTTAAVMLSVTPLLAFVVVLLVVVATFNFLNRE